MPSEIALFIGLVAILLGVVLALAITRGNALERIREALGAARGADLERGVRAAIDERAAAEARDRRRADDVALLTDLLGAGIIRVDDRLTISFANRAAHLFLGRRREELVGRTVMEAFGDHRVEEVAREARDSGVASVDVAAPGTPERLLVVRARRSLAEGVWVVIEDVSELRRLQRIRAEFIDNLSHELRTPLSTVRLLTETVLRDLEAVEVPDRLRDRMAKIDVETGHLVQMVNELLDLSRIEQAPTPLHLADIDVAAVARGAVERLRTFAERQDVTLTTAIPHEERLPTVRGDEERLGQLVLNLVHNAVKFSPPGSSVTVRAAATGGEVRLSVEDRGAGIPRADLDRIFERFYKVDKARVRGRGGTGLGLAIARHIAEGHGGRIWAESEEGQGATFHVALPIAGTS